MRLRRRPSEEILDAQLADIGVAGGKPIAGAGGAKRDPALAPSPETVVLQTMFSSLDDDSNRHVLGSGLSAVHLISAWALLHGVTSPCPHSSVSIVLCDGRGTTH